VGQAEEVPPAESPVLVNRYLQAVGAGLRVAARSKQGAGKKRRR